MAALNAIGTARSPYALKAALREHRPAVARAAGHPIPGCADPRGYWDVLLMHLTAATADKGSASGATAAIAGVPEIEHELTAELKQTAR
jgi:hypothetical protein